MSSKSSGLQKTLAVILMLAVGSFSSSVTATAMANRAPEISGEMTVSGTVTVNGATAASGITVVNETNIKTERNGSATVNLGQFGRLELGPETEMTLHLSETTIGGNLTIGQVVVSAPKGVGISVVTLDGIAVADGNQPSVLTVNATRGNTRVVSSRGEAKVVLANKVEHLASGQEMSWGTPTSGHASAGSAGGASIPVESSKAGIIALTLIGVGATAGILAATSGRRDKSVSPIRP